MAGQDQERRDEYAREHGYDSYYEFRQARDDMRQNMIDEGTDTSAAFATELLDFDRSLDVEGMRRDDLLDAWHDTFGYDADDAFYDWLHAHYEQTAG